jgi:steroid delta-isomerase-like uncharacterized protein
MPDAATVARAFVTDVLGPGDLAALDGLVHPDVVVHPPTATEPLRGRDALGTYIAGFRRALDGLDFAIEDVISEGDRAVVRLTVTGTHVGDLLGVAATGKRVSVPEVLILKVSDGVIVEDWVFADLLGLLGALRND